MNRNTRLRRVALLCIHFTGNCSYYRASWIDKKTSKANNQFWITVQSNFINIAIIEWIKLFGNSRDQHHWKNLVSKTDLFKTNMLLHCKLSSEEFDNYHKEMKAYRDKFVAHLDSALIMHVPDFTNAINSIKYYYSIIHKELEDISQFDFPQNLEDYYNFCFQESTKYFDQP